MSNPSGGPKAIVFMYQQIDKSFFLLKWFKSVSSPRSYKEAVEHRGEAGNLVDVRRK